MNKSMKDWLDILNMFSIRWKRLKKILEESKELEAILKAENPRNSGPINTFNKEVEILGTYVGIYSTLLDENDKNNDYALPIGNAHHQHSTAIGDGDYDIIEVENLTK